MKMNIDQLAQYLCKIARDNGCILTYKLEVIEPKVEHCCGAADFIYVEDAVCPACQPGIEERRKRK